MGIYIQIMTLQRYAPLEKELSRFLAEREYQGTCRVATLQMCRNTTGLDRCVDLYLISGQVWNSLRMISSRLEKVVLNYNTA